MSQLIPCSACQRHIRLTDTACPFCNAACSPTRGNARAGQLGRSRGLKRAAVFALSAGVSVTACGGDADDGDTTDQNAVPVYGAPVSPSNSVDSSDGVSPSSSDSSDDTETDYTATGATDVGSGDTTDPWDDSGLAQPEYGAPVPPPDDTATDDTATDDTATEHTPTEDIPVLDDAGATDAGAAQDGGADGGDVDGAALPPSQDASLLDPDPGPTVVPLYGAPPTQLE